MNVVPTHMHSALSSEQHCVFPFLGGSAFGCICVVETIVARGMTPLPVIDLLLPMSKDLVRKASPACRLSVAKIVGTKSDRDTQAAAPSEQF